MRPRLTAADLTYRLVKLDDTAKKKPYAKEYIKWGESSHIAQRVVRGQGREVETRKFHERPTCASRNPWYVIREQQLAAIAFPATHKRRPVIAYLSGSGIQIDKRSYGVYSRNEAHDLFVGASLTTTFSILCREIHGRANFGQGLLELTVYEASSLPVLNPTAVTGFDELSTAFASLSLRNIQMMYDEVRLPDRRALDDAFLNLVGFTDTVERADVLTELYDASCRSIWARQAKANNTREARQTYDDWLASGLPFGNVTDEDVDDSADAEE